MIEWFRLTATDKFVCTFWIILAFVLFVFIVSVVVTAVTTAFYNAKLGTLKKHGCLRNTKEKQT